MKSRKPSLKDGRVLFTLLLFLSTMFSSNLYSQACQNPPNNLVNGNFDLPTGALPMIHINEFDAVNNHMPGWFVSHGSPSTQEFANRSMWMWSYNNFSQWGDSLRGEGVYNCYNFQQDVVYLICFDLKTNGKADGATVEVRATNSLSPTTNHGVPNVPSEVIWQDLTVNYDTSWTRITTTYVPSQDYSQAWFYPFWGGRTPGTPAPFGNPGQAEMTIDNVVIKQYVPISYWVSPDVMICPGGSTQLIASGGQSYQWTPATGLSCTNCPSPIASPSTTTTYTVAITNTDGCEPETVQRQVTVSVGGCDIDAALSHYTYGCNGAQFYDASTWSPCTKNIHWYWDFGDGTTSTAQHPNHTFPGPGQYYVCLSTMGDDGFYGCIDDTCFWVEVGDPCSIDIHPTQTINQCTVQFSDSSIYSPCTRNIHWHWDFGDHHQSNAQHPTHTYTHPGTYQVCVTIHGDDGMQGCIDDTCYNITVNCPAPCACNTQADFSYTMDRCDVSFTDLSVPNSCTSITGWQWNFGDGSPFDFSQNPFHSYLNTNNYNVCLYVFSTDGNVGCIDTICKNIFVDCNAPVAPPGGGNAGNAADLPGMGVSVFPNPTSGKVYIELNRIDESPLNIDVLNSTGQLVKVLTPIDQKDVRTITWAPQEDQLPTGIYYIRISSGNEVQVKKVLFENR